jgi:release factor glutamine methyltransferase
MRIYTAGVDMISVSAPRARVFWRFFLGWRFRIFRRHRHQRLAVEEIDGVPLIVLPEVFNPALFRTSVALVRQLRGRVYPGMTVLDLGSGSGIGAVFAARHGAMVTAVDIAEPAVRCARMNALLNGCDREVTVRRGDLFTPVNGERFDLVLFNPPFFPGQPTSDWEYAWRSDDALERFSRQLPAALTPDGYALVVLSTDSPGAVQTIGTCGRKVEIVWQRWYGNERIFVIEVRP